MESHAFQQMHLTLRIATVSTVGWWQAWMSCHGNSLLATHQAVSVLPALPRMHVGWLVLRCLLLPCCSAPSSSMWLSNSPWCLMWDAYCNVLTTRPVATKLATGMVGTFLGDMVAQAMQNLLAGTNPSTRNQAAGSAARSGFELDLSRTGRLVGFSALVGTPVAFVWFSLLDQVCTTILCVFGLSAVCMFIGRSAKPGTGNVAVTPILCAVLLLNTQRVVASHQHACPSTSIASSKLEAFLLLQSKLGAFLFAS